MALHTLASGQFWVFWYSDRFPASYAITDTIEMPRGSRQPHATSPYTLYWFPSSILIFFRWPMHARYRQRQLFMRCFDRLFGTMLCRTYGHNNRLQMTELLRTLSPKYSLTSMFEFSRLGRILAAGWYICMQSRIYDIYSSPDRETTFLGSSRDQYCKFSVISAVYFVKQGGVCMVHVLFFCAYFPLRFHYQCWLCLDT